MFYGNSEAAASCAFVGKEAILSLWTTRHNFLLVSQDPISTRSDDILALPWQQFLINLWEDKFIWSRRPLSGDEKSRSPRALLL